MFDFGKCYMTFWKFYFTWTPHTLQKFFFPLTLLPSVGKIMDIFWNEIILMNCLMCLALFCHLTVNYWSYLMIETKMVNRPKFP